MTKSKPKYRIPTMKDVAKLRGKNGLTVVSTFSGCGGSCLGFEMAGYDVRWASEFVKHAQDTYRLNHPGVYLDVRDIRGVTPEDILYLGKLEQGELDVLEGSPPCAAFSSSGNREKDWGKVVKYSDTKQRVDDLFDEFVRILTGLQPRVFVAENVSGLVRGSAIGYFKDILAKLKAAGYDVTARLLDASMLGVPQVRRRIIFLGTRLDLGKRPRHPKPFPYRYHLTEVLPNIRRVKNGSNDGDGWVSASDRPAPAVVAMGSRAGTNAKKSSPGIIEDDTRFDEYALGKAWDKLRPGETSEIYQNLVRAAGDEPSPTVTATAGSSPGTAGVTHPFERRKFTIKELKVICSFPADFQLTGNYDKQWERLGRAVPPLMMRAIAETLRDEILT